MPEPARDGGRVWRAVDPGNLRWRHWGDDYIAYHRPSGKTHFLNAASHFLLTGLLSEPRTTDDIADALPDGTAAAEIRAMLERFEELGLLKSG